MAMSLHEDAAEPRESDRAQRRSVCGGAVAISQPSRLDHCVGMRRAGNAGEKRTCDDKVARRGGSARTIGT
jgi:hypothetical protein